MTISFVSESYDTRQGSVGDIVVAAPASIANGDCIVAIMASFNGGANALPSGFTLLDSVNGGDGIIMRTGYKIAASESGSYTATISAGSTYGMLELLVYRGVDQTNPIDAHNLAVATTGGSSATSTSLTTTKDGALLVASISPRDNTTISTPSGMTDRTGANIFAGNLTLRSFDEARATAGATGTRTSTLNQVVASMASMIALAPAASGMQLLL